MTTAATHCPECNAPLSTTVAHGLCPRCLMNSGLGGPSGEASVVEAARKVELPTTFPSDFGRYRLLRMLGRGGMGTVYEAEQRETGRRVALKVLRETIDTPVNRERFLREGRLAASVNHPNSVYIFGTEEIEGAPAIAMELVAGGTLRDELRRGPMAPRDAVDATLQIVAGLEAASNAGVLHRDVKPSNCFVAPDCAVKVGDYGLSISTHSRNDSQLTASGVMLGTLAYAPPEQLDGGELDVRADIHSVGATLYSLLTGRAPFEGENDVQVVVAVLGKPPREIAEFRKDVAPGLAQVVTKCMAKKRDQRFANYAALREALLPFSSQAPEPAPLGLRTLAGIFDVLLVTGIGEALLDTLGGTTVESFQSTRTPTDLLLFLGVLLFAVGYFAIPEGLWGASLGKKLCGLRVVGLGRGVPGIAAAMLRAVIVVAGIYLSDLIELALTSAEQVRNGVTFTGFTGGLFVILLFTGPLFVILLFITMRRRNGFAGIHELLTRTRVVMRQKSSERPGLHIPPAPTPEASTLEGAELAGPYHVVAPIAGRWLAGYDDLLRRAVWIRKCDAGTPALPEARCGIWRAGRLRWIDSARGEAEGWDAFDAPSGRRLDELSAQPWGAVRCWLLDLAEELDAAMNDHSLPEEIGIDHVFITGKGRALLLDEPCPGGARSRHAACPDNAGAQCFLTAFADAALERRGLPLHARDFLKKLAGASFDRASFIAGNLRSLLLKPPMITRRRRFASIALAPALALILAMPPVIYNFINARRNEAAWAARPELRTLELAVRGYNNLHQSPAFLASRYPVSAEDYATYITNHFGGFVNSPDFDSDPVFGQWPKEERDAVREIVRTHREKSPKSDIVGGAPGTIGEMERTDMEPVGAPLASAPDAENDQAIQSGAALMPLIPLFVILVSFLTMFIILPVSQFISLLIFRTTLGQRFFGFAVVGKDGEPAGRVRLLWRWCLVWGALAVPLFFNDLGFLLAVAGTVLFWSTCCVIAILNPERGVQDAIAGTRIVPR